MHDSAGPTLDISNCRDNCECSILRLHVIAILRCIKYRMRPTIRYIYYRSRYRTIRYRRHRSIAQHLDIAVVRLPLIGRCPISTQHIGIVDSEAMSYNFEISSDRYYLLLNALSRRRREVNHVSFACAIPHVIITFVA